MTTREVIRHRRKTGEPIPRWLNDHYARLDFLVRMSPPRHYKTEIDYGAAQSENDLIGADEAAEILGCTPRTVQRQGTTLSGQQIGGTWVFDRATIEARRNEP
ncbi:helix-turn-helix domain-containing protein [Mycobacterium avium]|uniref:helix-turn-helix domain-containing protein n=1 Tax=Mycobacterium avium TaxID=1764 RepID=UPI0012DA3F76|nr:helix-turn-helix domain-containing protein [Mycobacterium avium]